MLPHFRGAWWRSPPPAGLRRPRSPDCRGAAPPPEHARRLLLGDPGEPVHLGRGGRLGRAPTAAGLLCAGCGDAALHSVRQDPPLLLLLLLAILLRCRVWAPRRDRMGEGA